MRAPLTLVLPLFVLLGLACGGSEAPSTPEPEPQAEAPVSIAVSEAELSATMTAAGYAVDCAGWDDFDPIMGGYCFAEKEGSWGYVSRSLASGDFEAESLMKDELGRREGLEIVLARATDRSSAQPLIEALVPAEGPLSAIEYEASKRTMEAQGWRIVNWSEREGFHLVGRQEDGSRFSIRVTLREDEPFERTESWDTDMLELKDGTAWVDISHSSGPMAQSLLEMALKKSER